MITFIILFCSIQCAFADDVDEEIVEVNQEFTQNCINEVAKKYLWRTNNKFKKKQLFMTGNPKRILYGKNEK